MQRRGGRGDRGPRLRGAWTGAAFGALLGAAALTAGPSRAQEPAPLPIDRWLVASDFATAEDAAQTLDALSAAVREEAFPERLREVAGALWELVREDGSGRIVLEGAEGPAVVAHAFIRSPEDRTLRLVWEAPACGGVDLRLNGQPIRSDTEPERAGGPRGDTAPGAGGRGADSTDGGGALVRLAGGWNAIAARVTVDGCPPALAVGLLAGPRERDEVPPSLSGLRVQASRPPGVQRALPAPWVTVEEPSVARVSWPAEASDLAAELSLPVRAWGAPPGGIDVEGGERPEEPADAAAEEPEAEDRVEDEERPRPEERAGRPPPRPRTPPQAAPADPEERRRLLRERLRPPIPDYEPAPRTLRVEGRASGARWRTTVRLPAPGRPTAVSLPLSFEDLRRAAGDEPAVRLDLRWDGTRQRPERGLDRAAVEEALRQPIALTGWTRRVPDDGGDGEGAGAEPGAERAVTPGARVTLPRGPGERWAGIWRVPAALRGATLELVTDAAPGHFRLDGRPLSDAGAAVLCTRCEAGSRLAIEATSAGAWSRPPAVRIVEAPSEGGR